MFYSSGTDLYLSFNLAKKAQDKISFRSQVGDPLQHVHTIFSLFFVFLHSDSSQQKTILFPAKSLIYHCLHRNWIRAYSFSNLCLSIVYFLILILKHYRPHLLHHSASTFYSLPLTLVQQILINFSTFHLFIISVSVLQYFIRYYRLLKNRYSLNIYSGKNLLITKHTNVALILSGSLALIFAYNFIFYNPKHTQTLTLLPLITFNTLLLPLLDFCIFIFVVICCVINLYSQHSIARDLSFDPQQTSSPTMHDLRSAIERDTCIKCYSKILQHNRSLLQDNDPYTSLHSRYFISNGTSSARPSITPPHDKRKYSTLSFENIPMISDLQSRLRASYPCQTARHCAVNKSNYSPQDVVTEGRTEVRQNSATDLLIQATLLKLKQKRTLCHFCYRLLLVFLAKYALLTFPQHFREMLVYLRQFYCYILKGNLSTSPSLSDYNDPVTIWCRFLFLIARCGDSLILTCLPDLISKYFPCWCQCNSNILEKNPSIHRASHQILMTNIEAGTHESSSPTSEPNHVIDTFVQDECRGKQREWTIKKNCRKGRRHYRVRFQFIPIWSNYRTRLQRENS